MGILDKLFGGVFNAIGKGAAKAVIKSFDTDPVLSQLNKEIDEGRDAMAKRIADREKKDPKYAKELAAWRKANPI